MTDGAYGQAVLQAVVDGASAGIIDPGEWFLGWRFQCR